MVLACPADNLQLRSTMMQIFVRLTHIAARVLAFHVVICACSDLCLQSSELAVSQCAVLYTHTGSSHASCMSHHVSHMRKVFYLLLCSFQS